MNKCYLEKIIAYQNLIAFHYSYGSKFKSNFWKDTQNNAKSIVQKLAIQGDTLTYEDYIRNDIFYGTEYSKLGCFTSEDHMYIHCGMMNKSKKDILNYSSAVFNLINSAYDGLFIFSEISPKEASILSKQYLRFLKPEYVSFILNEEDELVAFGLVTPSIAKALQKCNGKLFPLGFIHLLRALKKNDTADLLLIAVKPEYQNKGIHSIIFNKITRTLIKNNIRYVETNREEESNQKVMNLWNHYENRLHKRARCYLKKLV